jgi:two-component system chemotaxis sensor kinase CheA
VDGLDGIVEEFLLESHEDLDQLDTDLVALGQEADPRGRLAGLHRTVHTIKGASGLLAFNRLEEVTRVGEDMLSRLCDGALELTPARTGVLLQMVDTVRALLTAIDATGGEGEADVSAVVAAVTAATEDVPAVVVPAPRGACDSGTAPPPAVGLGARAVQRGLPTSDARNRTAPSDVLQLLHLPGFSTAAAVTDVSGRAVGTDVVAAGSASVGGTMEVGSATGSGPVPRPRIPLTPAAVAALTVECAGDRYAIPQIGLQELVFLDAEKVADAVGEVGGVQVHRLRGDLLPLVRLTDVLGLASQRHDGHVVVAVLRSEGRRFGLVVDRVIDIEEIVVEAVDAQLKAIGPYSGATVLGDGTVALILDVQDLARRAPRTEATDHRGLRATVSRAADAETGRRRTLLASIGGGRRVAIPLHTVTRLERIRADAVETVGTREVVRYRGALLPIVRLDRHLGAHRGSDREVLQVIVHADRGRSVAIVVEEILDIVDGDPAIGSRIDDLGLLGSAVPGDRSTELLDVRKAVSA